MPAGSVQLLYRLPHDVGERLVADPRVGATGYTGSRAAGLALKAAADAAGKPIYLELSSINPVVILPGALNERLKVVVDEFTTSCLMGTGQFCTNPGMLLLLKGESSDAFVAAVAERFQAAPVGTLLSAGVARNLAASIAGLRSAGAQLVTAEGGKGQGYSHPNTLLRTEGSAFLKQPEAMQTEAFGNCSLAVVADDVQQACQVIDALEGNLTGSIYSHTGGSDDPDYERIEPHLRARVGRLLNDKMPTGVAVSSAMNHGGPYPATGHPGFTAVGIPASLLRFAMLQCYDQVRPHRLPACLQDPPEPRNIWRRVDGRWTQG
jgi:NADP-dependent aldehyde dehydrogenase